MSTLRGGGTAFFATAFLPSGLVAVAGLISRRAPKIFSEHWSFLRSQAAKHESGDPLPKCFEQVSMHVLKGLRQTSWLNAPAVFTARRAAVAATSFSIDFIAISSFRPLDVPLFLPTKLLFPAGNCILNRPAW
jgi:hypothetical protein